MLVPRRPSHSLIRAAENWRGLRVREFELRQLDAVRKELKEDYEASMTKSAHASEPRLSSSSMPSPTTLRMRRITAKA
jgi:hypothetical protein